MTKLMSALDKRREEVVGWTASQDECRLLRSLLSGTPFADMCCIYEQFAVCGLIVAFVAETSERIYAPSDNFFNPFDPETQHEFHWINIPQAIARITEVEPGRVIWADGYFPIGVPTIGGDPYYLRPNSPSTDFGLYRLFDSWINAAKRSELDPNGLELIATSFSQVVRTAHLRKGWSRD